MSLNVLVEEICEALEAIAEAVFNGKSDDNPLVDKGWNYPALSRWDLSAAARNLADRIRNACDGQDLDDDFLTSIEGLEDQLVKLQKNTIPQLYNNGNDLQAYVAYLATIFTVEQVFSQLLMPRWEDFDNPELMPKKLATKIRSISAQIVSMEQKIPDLESKLVLITDAHEAAESLPADLATLEEARGKVAKCKTDAETDAGEIASKKTQSVLDVKALAEKLIEAEGLINQLKDLHRVGTSTTLAGAFQAKAKSLSITVWGWSAILTAALVAIVIIGYLRVDAVTTAMNAAVVQWDAVWVNVFLTLFSVSAPVWLAWVATKQIAQRFRLAEDYAYKASISNAYEGYRREAVNLDTAFQTRLFDSALTRLDEVPGRLVDSETHGSPLHELLDSDAIKQAIKQVPDFAQQVKTLATGALASVSIFGGHKVVSKTVAGETQGNPESREA